MKTKLWKSALISALIGTTIGIAYSQGGACNGYRTSWDCPSTTGECGNVTGDNCLYGIAQVSNPLVACDTKCGLWDITGTEDDGCCEYRFFLVKCWADAEHTTTCTEWICVPTQCFKYGFPADCSLSSPFECYNIPE